ncbi:MAG: minor extracellular serine protease Vpr [Gaiellaceae bacterium]|nr:minor extracellular serine protease Vpr [Gaiellaceae bacterium]
MRRHLLLWLFAALLILTTCATAAAGLRPIRLPRHGDLTLPRVRHGVLRIPSGQARGRVTVLVGLRLPPLAQRYGPGLFVFGPRKKLDVASSASQSYLARLARAQIVAARQIRRAAPSARISYHYRTILDGLAVSLRYRDLPNLLNVSAVKKVYPSARYHLDTNKSPSIIRADTFWASTGGRGQGIKIAVVDDGVDEANPYFNPTGFSYPAGFPKGGRKWTTPKVIVARAFPGPGSGRQGHLALYRADSFHGTHVAGIAAGVAGTVAGPGPDHPAVSGLSGIAPRAWIGNYRVFNVPVPTGGLDAFTPEIMLAFEAAVNDGMDVINFSGGGPEIDPSSDALVQALDNVAAAGVVPVISAGNDRDDFGLGSVGSPSNAEGAISVAAVSNLHVFGSELEVTGAGAPASLQHIPFAYNVTVPPAWLAGRTLADVGTITGAGGQPVERHLCAPPGFDPNDPRFTTLPAGSLQGMVALVSRGGCTFDSKVQRVRQAGATGIVLVDNRPGEANFIGVALGFPGGMISDLDGANLRAYMAAHGGRTTFRATAVNDPREIQTGRSGVITSFSSAGPTNFDHKLKPDVAAPGGQILSSTLTEFAGAPFAVFDGTSMAAPHVSGAAALLLQQHKGWSPQQVKSALMTSAAPAWGNTARTQEASVLLEGGGLIDVQAANSPKLFSEPSSLSFGFVTTDAGPARKALLLSLSDAGGGGGAWSVDVQPQAATAGATLAPSTTSLSLPPGGTVELPIVATASHTAPSGDDYGFVVLRRGSDKVRVPYYFSVQYPQIGRAPRDTIKTYQLGDTSKGTSYVNQYRFPTEPFGPPPFYFGKPFNEDGAEQVYTVRVTSHAANAGAAVVAAEPNTLVEPWFLGSLNEDDVQGYPGTPVNVNGLTFEYQFDNGAAAVDFPHEGRYFVAVDSRADPYTNQPLRGQYVLHAWQNDVTPPRFKFLTKIVTPGRPLLAGIVSDRGAGVDPLSLVLGYKQTLLLAALYDPGSGLVLWSLDGAPRLRLGKTPLIAVASDYQESKNIDQAGALLPNSTFRSVRLRTVARPRVTWLLPEARTCVARVEPLFVSAGSARGVRSVRFFDGRKKIATVKHGIEGLYDAQWRAAKARHGRHVLRAVLTDRRGKIAAASRIVRVCRR